MSNANSALSVWQLVLMAVVPVSALVAWIVTIFIVAREPRQSQTAAVAAPVSLSTVARGTAGAPAVAEDELAPSAKEPVAA